MNFLRVISINVMRKKGVFEERTLCVRRLISGSPVDYEAQREAAQDR